MKHLRAVARRSCALLALPLALAACGEPAQPRDDGLMRAESASADAGPRLAVVAPQAAVETQLTSPSSDDDVDLTFETQEETELVAADAATTPSRRQVYSPGARPGAPRKQDAVGMALSWLAAHQHEDGHWDPADYGDWCWGKRVEALPSTEKGLAEHEVGVTSLALLAFLGAGYTHRGDHAHATVVQRGFRWLTQMQGTEGHIITRAHPTWLWDHAAATLALVEITALTESPLWRRGARQALGALSAERAAGAGVWGYPVAHGGTEESLTLWAALPLLRVKNLHDVALRTARVAPFEVDEPALASIRAWLERATEPATGWCVLGAPPHAAEEVPGGSPLALAALALLVRTLDCQDPKAEGWLKRGLESLARHPPSWDPTVGPADAVCWWAGVHSAFHAQEPGWRVWDAAIQSHLVAHQGAGEDPCAVRGSWAPSGAVGRLGGRVATTALLTLAMCTYFRYDSILDPCIPQPSPGTTADVPAAPK